MFGNTIKTQLKEATQLISTLEIERNGLKTELATLKDQLEKFQAIKPDEQLAKENETLKLELEAAKLAVNDFESKVSQKALDITASQGVPALKEVSKGSGVSKAELQAKLESIKDPVAARKFYVENYAILKD